MSWQQHKGENEQLKSELELKIELNKKELNASLLSFEMASKDTENKHSEVLSDVQRQLDGKKREHLEFKAKATRKIKELNKEGKEAKLKLKELTENECVENEKMKQQNESLLAQIEDLNGMLSNSEPKRKDLQEQLTEKETQIADLQQLLTDCDAQMENLQEEVNNLSVEVNDKSEETSAVKEMLQNSLIAMQELEEEKLKSYGTLEEMQKDLEDKTHKLEFLDELMIQKDNEYNNLLSAKQSKIVKLMDEAATLEDLLLQTATQKDEALAESQRKDKEISFLQVLSGENESLLQQLISCQVKESAYREEIAKLDVKICELTAHGGDKEEFEKSMISKSEELRQVIGVLSKKDEKLLGLQEVHDEVVGLNEVLKQKMNSKDEELNGLQINFTKLSENHNNMKLKTARLLKKSQAMKKVITEKTKRN